MRDVVGDPVAVETGGSELIDVTTLPLNALLSSEDTVLSNALRRLAQELADPRDAIAGWSSYQP
jgi:FXSXX-COOH protein